MKEGVKLITTLSNRVFPVEIKDEFSPDGESLEVFIPNVKKAIIREGSTICERFSDFLPFSFMDKTVSLGEGNTPLSDAGEGLIEFTGIEGLMLKNETQNPTWSFKDRGSLMCIAMSKEMGESITATVSTGNMGCSIAAYGAKSGVKVVVFVPGFTPQEKTRQMLIHGAEVIKITGSDYSVMKKSLLNLAKDLDLRVVSGNGPIRVEGYKLTAFEMFEQMNGDVPDYIAVPTSACGHIRGIFKGYKELMLAGIIDRLPRMIIVQAANNSPIVSALQQGKREVIPFSDFHTIAEAITTGNPMGGDEIIDKAYKYDWLFESVTESEIEQSQKLLAKSGYFVESASATSLYAVKKLRDRGLIKRCDKVVLMLTGCGLKDSDSLLRLNLNEKIINFDNMMIDISLEILKLKT